MTQTKFLQPDEAMTDEGQRGLTSGPTASGGSSPQDFYFLVEGLKKKDIGVNVLFNKSAIIIQSFECFVKIRLNPVM